MKPTSEMTLEERIAVQEAIEDTREVYFRYTRAMDHLDVDGIMECYADDAVLEMPLGEVGTWGKWVGKKKIREQFYEPDCKTFFGQMHYPINVIVKVKELDLDPNGSGEAEAFANLWAVFNGRVEQKGELGGMLVAWYDMKLRREKGQWKIKHFKIDVQHMVATKDFPFQKWHVSDVFGGWKPYPVGPS